MAKRFVKYGDKTMPVEEGLSLEQIKKLMARHFSELGDPDVKTEKGKGNDADTTYVFSKKAGTKGQGARHSPNQKIIRRLKAIKESPVVPADVLAACLHDHPTQAEPDELVAAIQSEADRVTRTYRALADLPSTARPGGILL